MPQHGFSEKQIYDSFELFDKETKAEQEKCTSFNKFNEDILKTTKEAPLAKIYKGIFVGNIFLKNAREEKHDYLVAQSEEFIIIIPYGPIQSVIHVLAIPKVPLYNVVSADIDNVLLMRKMQAALVRVVTDVLTPDSIPQRIYLRSLAQGIDKESSDLRSIKIEQERIGLDTTKMSGKEAADKIGVMLKDFYNAKMSSNIDLEDIVSTDLHIHPTNSVGQLHMHGWIAESDLITDNGRKLESKNTPLTRILPVLGKFRGGEPLPEREIRVIVKEKFPRTE